MKCGGARSVPASLQSHTRSFPPEATANSERNLRSYGITKPSAGNINIAISTDH
jgi:hypothetical protein